MKTLILISLILLAGCDRDPVYAEEVNLDIISQIESNGNPLAYNKRTGASGEFQIMPCVVEEYNARHKASRIAFKAVFNPVVARTVANWYLSVRIPQMLRYYGLPNTLENRLRAYNSGIGTLVKGRYPQETRDYVKKYHRLEGKV